MLTGKPPYANMTSMTALFRIVQDERPPLPENISPVSPLCPVPCTQLMRVSQECADFLTQCFQKDPLQRATALDLQRHPWIIKNVSAAASKGLEEDQQEDELEEIGTTEEASPGGHESESVAKKMDNGVKPDEAWETVDSYSDEEMFPEWRKSEQLPLEPLSPEGKDELLAQPSSMRSEYSSDEDDGREFMSDLRNTFALGGAAAAPVVEEQRPEPSPPSQTARLPERQKSRTPKKVKKRLKKKRSIPAFVNNTLKQSLRRFRESVGGYDEQAQETHDAAADSYSQPQPSPGESSAGDAAQSPGVAGIAVTPQGKWASQRATAAPVEVNTQSLPPQPLKQENTAPEHRRPPSTKSTRARSQPTRSELPSPLSIASAGTFGSRGSVRGHGKESLMSPDSMAFAALSADAKAEAEEEARTLSYNLALACAAYITWTGWREGEAETVDEAEDYMFRQYEEMVSALWSWRTASFT